jgi:predicted phage-related endonuclease
MGGDEAALFRLWREKRGAAEPEDLSGNLIVQLGFATEHLNRQWYERATGQVVKDVQSWVRHPVLRWMAATLDGMVDGTGTVFEAKFMLPWSFSEEAAAEKHMAQLQHNMWVTNATAAVLSIITGGGKWVEIKIPADSLYQHLLLTAEKKFWRCVESGEAPSDLRCRATAGPHRGGAHRRYECVKRLGRILQYVSADPRRLHRA